MKNENSINNLFKQKLRNIKNMNAEEIIVRTKNFELGPDVENHIQQMKKNGVLEKLAQENKLTVEELQKTSLGKMCEIFNEKVGKKLLSGDIIIFSDTGNFEVFTGGIAD